MSHDGGSSLGSLPELGPALEKLPPWSDRYKLLTLLGKGGVGEVRRTLDRTLQRLVAVKTLREELADDPMMVWRFVHEAQIVARLQHPAIVPVYDLGRLPDGRWYIAMPEIRGQNLDRVLRTYHDARRDRPLVGEYAGWTLRRLIEILRVTCEAVGYAHVQGVVHRDLKPENVMVGDYGEVLVVDWGLAMVIGSTVRTVEDAILDQHGPRWPPPGPEVSQPGVIAGTPAYMPPEQARGDVRSMGPWSDVWGLGGVLFTLLYRRLPYHGKAREVLKAVRRRPPEVPTHVDAPPQLVELWRKAMSMDPADRFQDAAEMAREITAWIEGSRARSAARQSLSEAAALKASLVEMQAEANRKAQVARAAVLALRPTDDLATKDKVWTLEEDAQDAHDQVASTWREIAAKARVAQVQAPELPDAGRFLADLYRERAEAAERDGDARALRELTELLAENDTEGRHRDFLRNEGVLDLHTLPRDAQAQLFVYRTRARRLAVVGFGQVRSTPLSNLPLPVGSYLAVIKAKGYDAVRFPFRIRRGERWALVPPGQDTPRPVWLPPEGALRSGDRLVPAGWSPTGGDGEAVSGLGRQRLWLNDYVMRDAPVTHGEYMIFLNDLVKKGHRSVAERFVPRVCDAGEAGEPLYRWAPGQERWVLPQGGADVVVDSDSPVVYVTWTDANAFCRWYRARTGLPWRLPGELEREKAARGVDERPYPWGEATDPAYCCMEDSRLDHPGAPAAEEFPADVSPYFVHGLAGGVREWCADVFRPYGPERKGFLATHPEPPAAEDTVPKPYAQPRAVRGGAWNLNARWGRAASRQGLPPDSRRNNLGFRLCRSLIAADPE
ncbi:MAG: SUMF1/EgtB/PvdO family nonheme iron enzyme [Alphaproteobacteria bacterium]|nr:SUMF1/EgtB/PvdO family nonheme iron enzyme [Alphaproteobacteria bacterium]